MEALFQKLSYGSGSVVLAFVTSLIVCILITPVVIEVAKVKHLMDEPNHRSSHKHRTATLGGLSIFAAVLIGFTIWGNFVNTSGLQFIISSLIILFFISLNDDILGMSPLTKLFAQILAALIVVYGADLRIQGFFGIMGIETLPFELSAAMTVFVFVVVINCYNLIDGIDGLAASIGIVASAFFGLWFYLVGSYSVAVLASSLIGALCGFLRYNFSKERKIFMGDTGSMIIGFIIAVFTIKFISMNEVTHFDLFWIPNAPIIAVSVLIIPLFDTLRVFMMRISQGKSPFYPDRSHVHHILIDKNLKHWQASLILFLFNVMVVLLAVVFFKDMSTGASALFYLGFFVVYSFALYRPASKNKPLEKETEEEQELPIA